VIAEAGQEGVDLRYPDLAALGFVSTTKEGRDAGIVDAHSGVGGEGAGGGGGDSGAMAAGDIGESGHSCDRIDTVSFDGGGRRTSKVGAHILESQ
jgi:hypothetical protein